MKSARYRVVQVVNVLYPLVAVLPVLLARLAEAWGFTVEEIREDQRLLRLLNEESEGAEK